MTKEAGIVVMVIGIIFIGLAVLSLFIFSSPFYSGYSELSIIFGVLGIVLLFSGAAIAEVYGKKEKENLIPNTKRDRYCPECGRAIPFDANVCPYCGKKF